MRQYPRTSLNHGPVRASVRVEEGQPPGCFRSPHPTRSRALNAGILCPVKLCLQEGIPVSRQREAGWGPSQCPPPAVARECLLVTPELPPPGARGARRRGSLARLTPPPGWGRGRGGGSRWQQLRLGPSPAHRPRPEDQLRELSWTGGAAASSAGSRRAGSWVGGAGPGGDFLPPGVGLGESLRKG